MAGKISGSESGQAFGTAKAILDCQDHPLQREFELFFYSAVSYSMLLSSQVMLICLIPISTLAAFLALSWHICTLAHSAIFVLGTNFNFPALLV